MNREPLRIVIAGKPVAKARPRYSARSKHFYTPSNTRKAEDVIRSEARLALKNQKPFLGPLRVRVDALIPVPKSWPGIIKDLALSGRALPGKPDVDNYAKLALDALNDVVFADDAQVVDVRATKQFAIKGATIITVEEYRKCVV